MAERFLIRRQQLDAHDILLNYKTIERIRMLLLGKSKTIIT